MSSSSNGDSRFKLPRWRPLWHRQLPPHVINAIRGIDGSISVGATKWITSMDVAKGEYAHLGVSIEGGELVFPQSPFLISPRFGRFASWNVHGRTVVRDDLPKEYRRIRWNGLAFGKYPTTFSKDGVFYKREHRYGKQLKVRVVHLRSEFVGDTSIIVIAVVFVDDLAKSTPDFDQEVMFRINLLQEGFGAVTALPSHPSDEQLMALVFTDWLILPPAMRTLEIANVLSRQGQGQSLGKKLIERIQFIQELCPEVQIVAGTQGFSGYFLAKISSSCVIAEHVEPGNAIYVFGENWQVLSRISRTRLRREFRGQFRRIEHEGNWKTAIKRVIQSGRGPRPLSA